MKKIPPLYLLGVLALLSSCTSFKNIAAKDNSSSNRTRPKNSEGNTIFLENISVTPGSKRTSALIASNTVAPPVNTNPGNFNMESAAQVQVKYATILDVRVEELSNIPLLQDIDYWWGTKYCMGGSTESCTDCSAFTQNIIRDVYAVQLPRTAVEQYNSAARIKFSELREGDLVFFQTRGKGISHVGIYLTNNKFVHASVSNGVIISDLNEAYWKPRYKAAGRVVK